MEGDLYLIAMDICVNDISIHALRVEGDYPAIAKGRCSRSFLSTPSGWRATRWGLFCYFKLRVFLSTPSGWRATWSRAFPRIMQQHFYPRPPGGGRLKRVARLYRLNDFYPRPPGGGRRWGLFCYFKLRVFLSTPSGWRATGQSFLGLRSA